MPNEKKLQTIEDYREALEQVNTENAELRKRIEEIRKTVGEKENSEEKEAESGKNIRKSEGASLLDDTLEKLKAAEGLFLIVAPQYVALLKAIEALMEAFKTKEKEKSDSENQNRKLSHKMAADEIEINQPEEKVEKTVPEDKKDMSKKPKEQHLSQDTTEQKQEKVIQEQHSSQKKGIDDILEDGLNQMLDTRKSIGTDSKDYTNMIDSIIKYSESRKENNPDLQKQALLHAVDNCDAYVKKNDGWFIATNAGKVRMRQTKNILEGLQNVPEYAEALAEKKQRDLEEKPNAQKAKQEENKKNDSEEKKQDVKEESKNNQGVKLNKEQEAQFKKIEEEVELEAEKKNLNETGEKQDKKKEDQKPGVEKVTLEKLQNELKSNSVNIKKAGDLMMKNSKEEARKAVGEINDREHKDRLLKAYKAKVRKGKLSEEEKEKRINQAKKILDKKDYSRIKFKNNKKGMSK